MSKEIYINTGTSFQQQYTARQPAIGTAPITAQYDAQGNASSQTPFTYTHRTPYTFRSPVNAQSPYIANAQQPYPYIANSQTPYPANAQQPYPYPANAQQNYPYIASAQQPYPYIATSQTPFTYQARQPSTYPRANVQARQPNTYQARSPFTYPRTNVQGRQPSTYNARTPFTYPVANVSKQTPYIANQRQPFPYIAVSFSQAPYSVQTSAGTSAQYATVDHTTPSTQAWQVVGRSPNVGGYIVSRYLKIEFRIMWWRHTNGYGYGYWYVRRGTQTGTELNSVQATFYGQSPVGTVTLDTTNWRLFEQWSFWTAGVFPDSIGCQGTLSATVSTASLALGATRETTVSRSDAFECEEGIVFTPSGGGYSGYGDRQSTVTITPNASRTNYPTLTGISHTGTLDGAFNCNWYCFLADSQVLLEDNTTKNIQDMQVGDLVIGKDGIVNAVVELRVRTKTDKVVYTINGSFKTTAGHPLLSKTGWKSCNSAAGKDVHPELNITELEVGDILLKDAGNANGDTVEEAVTSITLETPSGETTFYNLDVTDSPSGNDTYVVDNYIVHNK